MYVLRGAVRINPEMEARTSVNIVGHLGIESVVSKLVGVEIVEIV